LAYSVIRQDLIDERRLDHFAEMSQLRLFRNRPEVRFVGRFHHQPSPSLTEAAARHGLELRDSHIRLRHYGYTSNRKLEKNRRAVRLLELELADRPGQFYYLVELGATLLSLGKPDGHQKLHQAALMVVNDDPQVTRVRGSLAILLEYILANPKLPPDFPLSKQQARRLALERFPASVPLLWRIAAEENSCGRYADCASLLERIIKLGEDHSYDRTVSFDPAIMREDAKLNLGVCYVRMGKLDSAELNFRELLNSPTRSKQAADNLRAIRNLRAK
jgi:tetratricopeptide (TPR) repeat protein